MELRIVTIVIFIATQIPLVCKAQYRTFYNEQLGSRFRGLGFEAHRRQSYLPAEPVSQPTFNAFAFARQNRQNYQQYQPQSLPTNRGNFRLSLIDGVNFIRGNRQHVQPRAQSPFNGQDFGWQNRQAYQQFQPQSQRDLSRNRRGSHMSLFNDLVFGGENRESYQRALHEPQSVYEINNRLPGTLPFRDPSRAFSAFANGWEGNEDRVENRLDDQPDFLVQNAENRVEQVSDYFEEEQERRQNQMINNDWSSFIPNRWTTFEDGIENRQNVIDNRVENRIEQTENIHDEQAADILRESWESTKDQVENNAHIVDNSNYINDRYDNNRGYVDLWGNNAHSSGWNSFISNKGDSFEDVVDNRLNARDNHVENRIEQTENINGNQVAGIFGDSWDLTKDGVENNVDIVENTIGSGNNINNRLDNDRDFVDLWGTNALSSGWNSFISNGGDSNENVVDNRLDAIDNSVENSIAQIENTNGQQTGDILENRWDSTIDRVENNAEIAEDSIGRDNNVYNRFDGDREFVELWGNNAQSSGWKSVSNDISNQRDLNENVVDNHLDAIDNRIENRIQQIENTNGQETGDILEHDLVSTKDQVESNLDIVQDIIGRDNNVNKRFDNDREFVDLLGTIAQSSVWNSFMSNRGDSNENVVDDRLDAIDNRVENSIEQIENTNAQETGDSTKDRVENNVDIVEDIIGSDNNINNRFDNDRDLLDLWGTNKLSSGWKSVDNDISNTRDSNVVDNRLDAIGNRIENRIEHIENTNGQETGDILENGRDSTKDRVEINVDVVEDIIDRETNINNKLDNDRNFVDLWRTNAQSSGWISVNNNISNRGDSNDNVVDNRLDAIDNRVENNIEQITNGQETGDILEKGLDSTKDRVENKEDIVEDVINSDNNINNRLNNDRDVVTLWRTNAQSGGWNSLNDSILNRGVSNDNVVDNRLDAIDNRVENRIEQIENTNGKETSDILENIWDATKNRIENMVNNVEDNIEDNNINTWYGNNRGFFNVLGINAEQGGRNRWTSYEDVAGDW